MSRLHSVFLSTTAVDLTEYCKTAIYVCRWIGLRVRQMAPCGHQEFELNHEQLVEASLYIGILAHRYGWQPPEHGGKSITQLEYELAEAFQLPILIFMIDSQLQWSPAQTDLGDEHTKLSAFKQHLIAHHPVRFFRSVEEFGRDLLIALLQHKERLDK